MILKFWPIRRKEKRKEKGGVGRGPRTRKKLLWGELTILNPVVILVCIGAAGAKV